jgi:sorbitol-specific phosphotransferase system component IIC
MLVHDYKELEEIASMGIAPPIQDILYHLGVIALEFLIICLITSLLYTVICDIIDSLQKKDNPTRPQL